MVVRSQAKLCLLLLVVLPTTAGCRLLAKLREDKTEHYRHCEVRPSVNDLFAEKADGYTVKIPGEYDDLLVEGGYAFDIRDDQGGFLDFVLTLKSADHEGHGFVGRFSFSHAGSVMEGAPVKQLKPAAYLENGGPVDPEGWTYYRLVGATLDGIQDSPVETTVFKLNAVTSPIQLGQGADNHAAALGLSGAFSGIKVVTNVVSDLEKPQETTVPAAELAFQLACETKTVDTDSGKKGSDDWDDDEWDD